MTEREETKTRYFAPRKPPGSPPKSPQESMEGNGIMNKITYLKKFGFNTSILIVFCSIKPSINTLAKTEMMYPKDVRAKGAVFQKVR